MPEALTTRVRARRFFGLVNGWAALLERVMRSPSENLWLPRGPELLLMVLLVCPQAVFAVPADQAASSDFPWWRTPFSDAALDRLSITLAQAVPEPDMQKEVIPMAPELGMLGKTYLAVSKNDRRWVASFCAAILPLTGEDYARFVRLVREETTNIETYYEKPPLAEKVSFLSYTRTLETRTRAFECLEHAGEAAPAQTQFDLYLIGTPPHERSGSNPFRWLRKAADGSYPLAKYVLAERMLNNPSDDRLREVTPVVAQDKGQLFQANLRAAAEAGVPQAQYLLGALLLEGTTLGPTLANIPQGIEWLKRAASQAEYPISRDNAAQKLGTAYFDGKLVPRDYQEAFRWYAVIPKEKVVGIRAPYAGVGNRLWQMYCGGLGVERDPQKAQTYTAARIACP